MPFTVLILKNMIVRLVHTRLVLKMSFKALPEAATLIVYGEFPGKVEIYGTKNIKVYS